MQAAPFVTGFAPDPTVLGVEFSWPLVNSLLGNGYFFVIGVTFLSLLLLGVFCIVKYAPLMHHDLKNTTNQDFPDTGIAVWMAFLFALPLFFDVGVGMLIAWWFILLWNYMLEPERRIAYVFAFIVLVSSWLAHLGAGFIAYADDHANREIFLVEHGLASPGDIRALESWVKVNTDDADPMNTIAVHAITKGNYSDAVRLLNRCIDLDPGNPRYHNHLAIALAGTGKTKEAVRALQDAASLSPATPIYHYNLSRIHQTTYSFYEAEKAIATASGIDADLVRSLLDRENTLGRTRYILERTPITRLLSRQMRPSKTITETADAAWYTVFGLVPRNLSVAVGMGVILMFILMNAVPPDKFSKKCSRCGKVYYAGARTRAGSPLCLQCSWLESKAKKQGGQVVHQKAEEIRRYKAQSLHVLHRIEMFLPGLGSLLVNHTRKAVVRVAVLSACIVMLTTGGGIIVSFIPSPVPAAGLYIRIAAVCCLAVLILRAYRAGPLRYGG